MSNNIKTLFRFKVDKIIKEKIEVDDTNASGEKITVVKEVDKAVPYEFALLTPTRGMKREAEIFYNSQLRLSLMNGMILKANLVAKLNDDGSLFKEELKKFDETKSKFLETAEKLKTIMMVKVEERTEEQKTEFTKLSKDHYDFLSELNRFESVRQSVLSSSAESYSTSKLLEWWMLQLSCKIDDKGNPAPIFNQPKFEDKIIEYDKILDADNEKFIQDVLRDFSYIITFWSMGNAETEEDFDFALKKSREV